MALRNVLDDVTSVDGFTMSFILGASLIILYWRLFVLRLDAQEPPILKSRIPVVGHILGMLHNSHGYWKTLQ